MIKQAQEDRDQYIIQDYKAQTSVKSLARSYGLSDRRIMQILNGQGVEIRPRLKRFEIEPISKQHERIGRFIADYVFDNEIDLYQASIAIGWNFSKLRKTFEGIIDIELLDLLDIASYTNRTVAQVISDV
jgi:hypothetical protein